MLKQDYVLRMIDQLARAVGRLVARMRQEDREKVEESIGNTLEELTGLRFDLLDTLSLEALLKILEVDGERDPARCLAIAEMCLLRSELDRKDGFETKASNLQVRALTLFLEALFVFRHAALAPTEERVERLVADLGVFDLPPETLIRLFRYRASQGRFADAEDALFELVGRGLDDDGPRAEGRAFYERLLTLDDATLEAGRLPRDEVEEALADL